MGESSGKPRQIVAVPGSRIARFSRLAQLAGGVAGGMLAEGGKAIARGRIPRASDLLLTPANARKVADQLAKLRGAAMKVGQLLSMDSGELLPPELADVLARLRSDGAEMPRQQVQTVLNRAWGKGWESRFAAFNWSPVATASIGQVHRARTHDGRDLALKIQYPGVARSIDSDVENVVSLLRLSRLLPASMDLDPLVSEAKRQLRAEADYQKEAMFLQRFADQLGDDPAFLIPTVHAEFSTRQVLVMDFIEAADIDSLASASITTRQRAIASLFDLLFREMFDFRLVQTDPNFGNYLYLESADKVVLLDFGATRSYSMYVMQGYRDLFGGVIRRDREQTERGARRIGYLAEDILDAQREHLLDLLWILFEPLGYSGSYHFRRHELPQRLRDSGLALSFEKNYWHSPPVDAIFLHRKLIGLYMLATRLDCPIDVNRILLDRLEASGLAA